MENIIKPVFWTNRAQKDLDKIIRFNAKLFDVNKAIAIAQSIQQSTEILENPDFTKLGAVDEDFVHLKYQYRKIFEHHCKLTYREGKTKIYIVRVFDTRQHPNKNS